MTSFGHDAQLSAKPILGSVFIVRHQWIPSRLFVPTYGTLFYYAKRNQTPCLLGLTLPGVEKLDAAVRLACGDQTVPIWSTERLHHGAAAKGPHDDQTHACSASTTPDSSITKLGLCEPMITLATGLFGLVVRAASFGTPGC